MSKAGIRRAKTTAQRKHIDDMPICNNINSDETKEVTTMVTKSKNKKNSVKYGADIRSLGIPKE